MTKETMTIHKALAELKLLDKRIQKAVMDTKYCACVKNSTTKVNGMTVEEFKENTKSSYQRILDMIRRRDAIKKAVAKSNATTTVEIDGVAYTVAEAIWMNQAGMDAYDILYRKLNQDYASDVAQSDRNNAALDDKAEQFIISMSGSKEKVSINSEEVKAAKKAYMDSNTCSVVSGFDVKEELKALDAKINSFRAECDAALSSSNATTMIEVVY